jgi:hypothetical protein
MLLWSATTRVLQPAQMLDTSAIQLSLQFAARFDCQIPLPRTRFDVVDVHLQ